MGSERRNRERSLSRERSKRRERSGSREKKREKRRDRSGSKEGRRSRSRSREGRRRRPSLDKRLERSQSRERRRRDKSGSREKRGGGGGGDCFKCGEPGHFARDCKQEGEGAGGRGGGGKGGCFECGENGHIARECPQKGGGGGRGGGGGGSECYKCHKQGHFARECTGEGGEDPFKGVKESDRYGLQTMKKPPPPGVLTGANAGAGEEGEGEEVEKEGVNMGLSGALTEDVNTFNGVVIKYSEPPEARVPKRRWRFYVFKGDETLPTLHLHRQSAYLLGKDRKVCDLPIDHPSSSRQHAVLQYRLVSKKKDDGSDANRVIPYVIDLGSSNGTYLNNTRIESKRYYELKESDVLKFGFSTREYVLLHENSGE